MSIDPTLLAKVLENSDRCSDQTIHSMRHTGYFPKKKSKKKKRRKNSPRRGREK